MEEPSPRDPSVDGLRVVVVYGIALFHISLVFSVTPWLISNSQHSLALSAFAGFTFTWGMPAIFLLAGGGQWFALRHQSPWSFAISRTRRLLVPLVLGVLVLSPLQLWTIGAIPPVDIRILPTAYLQFWESLNPAHVLSDFGGVTLHLWFLAYLLAISLVCIPLTRQLQHTSAQRLLARLAAHSALPGGALLPAVPLCIAEVLLRPAFPRYESWADVTAFLYLFMAGASLMARPQLAASIRSGWRAALGVGTGAVLALGIAAAQGWMNPTQPSGAPAATLLIFDALWGLNTWCWLVVLMALGHWAFRRPSPWLRRASDAALDFYVVHHPVVLLVAGFVVPLGWTVWVKASVMVAVVYALALGLVVAMRAGPPTLRDVTQRLQRSLARHAVGGPATRQAR